ncbi:DUF885 domain-containing protein [Umezawaea endophytica]|uniref:DUF885 domain-containing protein n=1 Tax=Umezawaea endophytica TaxID=1654476 RepID=A0A9X2VHM4_9PSEU|nr:DUF885 domain-containing protein [Umezawaea endophytica]MCS7476756.1 DUF885 domain-containing protein [Umezawaea endophytica]
MNVNALSDRYVAEFAALDPLTGSYLGVPGHDEHMTDFSPEGYAARGELRARTLREIATAPAADAAEELAREVFTERVGTELALHEAGLDEACVNTINSPIQEIRLTFDLMSSETAEDWEKIAKRMAKVPDALTGLGASLTRALGRGTSTSARQLVAVAAQCETWSGRSGTESFFTTFVGGAAGVVGPALLAELEVNAKAATAAFAEFADHLHGIAPRAPERDGVGPDIYALWSRQFLGARIDLIAAYEWAWDDFARVEREMREVAGRIKPGASVAEVAALLDADPRHHVEGRAQYGAWMQKLSDEALQDLRGVHFDIPDELMRFEVREAPPGGTIGQYYAAPTDDFSRPGSTWWIAPADRTVFPTWRHVSRLYHEGVPGHHLQLGTAVYQAKRLNKYQRLLAFAYGHGEGWALYAERLMRDLGYISSDGDVLGTLSEELYRSARVILDIGLHLGLAIPKGTGFHEGERWTPALAVEFFLSRTTVREEESRGQVDRYLGWPAQATSYKLGERLWLEAIGDARARHGSAFDLKRFHMRALEMGSMGLDTLGVRLAAL